MVGFSFGVVQMVLYLKYKNAEKMSSKQKLPETVLTQVVVLEEPKITEQIIKLNEPLNSDKIREASKNDEVDAFENRDLPKSGFQV